MSAARLMRLVLLASALYSSVGLANVRAVVVGISSYKEPSVNRSLKYGSTDASSFRDVLVSVCGVDSSSVTLLLDAAATGSAIEGALGGAATSLGEEDLFIFFFSGHGAQVDDKENDERDGLDEALVPWDGDTANPATLLLDDLLGYHIRRLKAGYAMVFLDACYSGGQGKSVPTAGLNPRGRADTFEDLFGGSDDPRRCVLLAASEADQEAFEDIQLGGGRFTHFLLEGIRDLRADRDQDKTVDIDELAQYVAEKLADWKGSPGEDQSATYMNPEAIKVSVVPIGPPPGICVEPEVVEIRYPDKEMSITVRSSDGRRVEYAASTAASWIDIRQPTGVLAAQEEREVSVFVDVERAGTQRTEDRVKIRPVGGGEAKFVSVVYDPAPPPVLSLDPDQLSFEFQRRDEIHSFRIGNRGGGALDYRFDSFPEWLELSQTQGRLAGSESDEVRLGVARDASPGERGSANLRLRVTGSGMVSENVTIPVALKLLPNLPQQGVTVSLAAAACELLSMADSFGPVLLMLSVGARWDVGGFSFAPLPMAWFIETPWWGGYANAYFTALRRWGLEFNVACTALYDSWDLSFLVGPVVRWWAHPAVSVGLEVGVALTMQGDWDLIYGVNHEVVARSWNSFKRERVSLPVLLLEVSFVF